MKNTLVIEKFGPLIENSIEIKKAIIVLGPQASGKSTFAKLVYIFKNLKTNLLDVFLLGITMPETLNDVFATITRFLKQSFIESFGNFPVRENFSVKYFYTEEISCEVYNQNKQEIEIKLSPKFKQEISKLVAFCKEYIKNNQSDVLSANNTALVKAARLEFIEKLTKKINQTTNDDNNQITFIPATRSFVNKYKDLQFLKPSEKDLRLIDNIDLEFIKEISAIKRHFNLTLEEQIKSYDYINSIDTKKYANKSIELINNILRGKYIFDSITEKIAFKDDKNEHFVEIANASSGQQESLWILNILFRQILEKEKYYTVIEEPEAHLYPEAQNNIAKLIALAANKGISLLITTHSPYFLGCLSTLFYAKTVENKIRTKKLSEDLNLQLYKLDINEAAIYYIKNGKLENIYSESAEYITVESIDGASEENNDLLYKLMEIDINNEEESI